MSFILDTDVIAVKYVVPSHMDTDSKQDSFFVFNGLHGFMYLTWFLLSMCLREMVVFFMIESLVFC